MFKNIDIVKIYYHKDDLKFEFGVSAMYQNKQYSYLLF